MTALLISDLHLDATRPDITALFLDWLQQAARQASWLGILGDLFEAWVGDDTDDPLAARVADALRALADSGVRIDFIRGNRDFLIGQAWAERAGLRILPDPCVIELGGAPVLLLHGDLLCTDDTAYQAFRQQSRTPAWRAQVLAQPLAVRKAMADQARAASRAHQSGLDEAIMDANADAIRALFRRYGVRRMIHGHTHRPAIHDLDIDGVPHQRIVLGDWYTQGSCLRIDASGFTLQTLPLTQG